MKTITEFSGFTIKQANDLRAKLVAEGVASEQQSEKLGEQASLSGDRLSRLVEALEAVGDQVDKVRLVRVFPVGETEMKGAKKVGEFQYLLDFHPNMAQARGQGGRGGDRDRGRGRGGPGGGGGGGSGGGGRPGGFGKDRSPYEKEPPRGSTPSAGAGWILSRAPSLPGERRDGDKRGPGGKRPAKPGRRGPGGPGGGPGGRPGGGPGGGAPGRQHAGPGRPGGGPGGGGPGRPGGGPDRGPRDPNAPAGQRPHRGRGARPQGTPPVVILARPHAPAPAPAAPEAAPAAAPGTTPENT